MRSVLFGMVVEVASSVKVLCPSGLVLEIAVDRVLL